MRKIRLSIIGFGTVGRWLAEAIYRRRAWLEGECGVAALLCMANACRRKLRWQSLADCRNCLKEKMFNFKEDEVTT